ncbi:hypothetical protein [Streptomyces sp. NPDC005969]|uniref:hypothetical protein n=1 Tax=Streptomyces sp. NPDC005969 TaxID=3156722 RepID=UPI0033E9E4AE
MKQFLLQKYVLVRVGGGRTAILGPGSWWGGQPCGLRVPRPCGAGPSVDTTVPAGPAVPGASAWAESANSAHAPAASHTSPATHGPHSPVPPGAPTSAPPSSNARVNMHCKLIKTAIASQASTAPVGHLHFDEDALLPVGILSDAAVYLCDSESPAELLPHTPDGSHAPGTFRLGVSPGMVKHEGTRDLMWAVNLLDQGHNPANYIKPTDMLVLKSRVIFSVAMSSGWPI